MSSDASSTSAASVLKGSCLCGQIAYEITGEPSLTMICHCGNCRKWTGTSTAWEAFFPREQVRISQGESLLKTYLDTATTSTVGLERMFCSNCGGSLFVSSLLRPNVLGVTAGGVDTDVSELWKPSVEVWCKDRPTWLPEVGTKCFQASSGSHKKE